MPPVRRQKVESTCIGSVGYIRKTRVLEIEFKTGRVYRYFEVSEKTYQEILKADSKGRFFNAHIKGHYPYEETDGLVWHP